MRSEYFISLNNRKLWAQYKEDSIFYVTGKGDLFIVKEVFVRTKDIDLFWEKKLVVKRR